MEKSFNNTELIQGVGISARPLHFSNLLEKKEFPWLECLADNYLHQGSVSRQNIRKLSEIYPLVFHCVGMSLASSDDFNWDYMKSLKSLVTELSPKWISDHLCFSSFKGNHYHDLIPIPYTMENAAFVAGKITTIQDFFELPFLLENVSNYIAYSASNMEEVDFLNEIAARSGCQLLLDVNNIFVNSINHKFDPFAFIDRMNLSVVGQIHLAGYKDMGDYLVDTHSHPVHEEVLKLYKYTIEKASKPVPTCLEWDTNIPSFNDFAAEHLKIKRVYDASA